MVMNFNLEVYVVDDPSEVLVDARVYTGVLGLTAALAP